MGVINKNILIHCGNLFLGLFLLCILATNIEFNSTVANMTFPFLVLVAAHLSCKRFTPKTKGRLFFYLPSVLCGYGFYILGCILVLLNFMGAFFWFSEESHKVKIQTCYSPNKIEYCESYHYPAGQSITINVHSVEHYKGVILLTVIAYTIVLLVYLIIHTKV